MKMTQFKSNDPEDYEAIKKAIDEQLEEALDPEAYAVRKMFDKMKAKPEPAGHYWDSENEVWLPKGTKIKPHPWDTNKWDEEQTMNKYKRQKKPITQKDVDRFWGHVDIKGEDECWEWLRATTKGYGLFAAGGTYHRSSRFAYVHRDGKLNTHKIPGNLRITNKCGNKRCCNPKHLKLFSHQEVFDKMAIEGKIVVGSKHRMSKLTETDITDIRSRYQKQSETNGLANLAQDYGVSPGCIRDIIIRKTWRHVD